VMNNISKLAREVENDERKWFISWIFDNSDQMGAQAQHNLVQIVRRIIPQQPTDEFALDPVREKGRELWRVIIPIRPETEINLISSWDPAIRTLIHLDPVDPDLLVSKRADYVFDIVKSSKRHFSKDPLDITNLRPDFDLRTPGEMAETLNEALLAANRLQTRESTTTQSARKVLDKLINNSARRRLNIIPRVALSRSFLERYERGLREEWSVLVTPFYFFDGLLRNNKGEFDASDPECLILNLYDLGPTCGHHHSIFVGVHSIYLLHQGIDWPNVRTDLSKIGYTDNDLDTCEERFLAKELIKKLLNGNYLTEQLIVDGHWELLKERAYTDNMAVACARTWGDTTKAKQFDPFNLSQLVDRFDGSLWFIKKIWEAEQKVNSYTINVLLHNETFENFKQTYQNIGLPSITNYIAREYLYRMQQSLPSYELPFETIATEKERWDKYLEELRQIVDQSSKPVALQPHR
jgi:hypothetical protein